MLYWVAERFEWQLLWAAAAALVLTAALFALTRWAFGQIRSGDSRLPSASPSQFFCLLFSPEFCQRSPIFSQSPFSKPTFEWRARLIQPTWL